MTMENPTALVSWITLIGIFIGLYFTYIKLDIDKKETVKNHVFTALLILCFVLAAYVKSLIPGEIGKSEIISAASFETVLTYFSMILLLILAPIFMLIFKYLDVLQRYNSEAWKISKSHQEIMMSQSKINRDTNGVLRTMTGLLKSSTGAEKEKIMEEIKTMIEQNQRID